MVIDPMQRSKCRYKQGAQVIKNFLSFMEHEDLLPSS
jgi:hypothetical protein